MKIGNIEIYKYKIDGKKKYGIDSDCEGCPFAWSCYGWEGDCEDCGCYMDENENMDVPYWICAIPYRIKELIKKLKRWE